MSAESDTEDYLGQGSLNLFGDQGHFIEVDEVGYGPIRSRIPEAQGKAFTRLASQVFNSGLVMAEMVELGRIRFAGKQILEIGASTSFPSLLASTSEHPPASILTTDYPDEALIKNLQGNLDRNMDLIRCPIRCAPYKWGDDVAPLLQTLSKPEERFDLLIAADCLWLHDEHTNLLNTLTSSLSQDGQAFFTTGHYAKRPYVDEFFRRVEKLGFSVEELDIVPRWEGTMEVDLGPGRLKEDLDLKKAAVWAFIVRRE